MRKRSRRYGSARHDSVVLEVGLRSPADRRVCSPPPSVALGPNCGRAQTRRGLREPPCRLLKGVAYARRPCRGCRRLCRAAAPGPRAPGRVGCVRVLPVAVTAPVTLPRVHARPREQSTGNWVLDPDVALCSGAGVGGHGVGRAVPALKSPESLVQARGGITPTFTRRAPCVSMSSSASRRDTVVWDRSPHPASVPGVSSSSGITATTRDGQPLRSRGHRLVLGLGRTLAREKSEVGGRSARED